MNHIQTVRPTLSVLLLFAVFLTGVFAPAIAQIGPRDARGTQLGRDPGRPMITTCMGAQPCRFVGLVDPGGLAAGPVILDSGYFAVCTPGACGTPAPFAITPAFLGGTAVAAGGAGIGGVGGVTVGAITAGVLGGALGGVFSAGGPGVQTGSQ